MAKKKRTKRTTPEEEALLDERTRKIWARIAEREAREQEAAKKSA
jgi:hypothetical protein